MRTKGIGELSPALHTQLELIRELMLALSSRGAWLTLAEISEQTEIGEASISAQLRHLRKPRHGRYKVEKRKRPLENREMAGDNDSFPSSNLWEYRVWPPGFGIALPKLNGRVEGESIEVRVEAATGIEMATGDENAKTRD